MSELTQFLIDYGCKESSNELYLQAFIHASYSNENGGVENLERLEFMGDSVLQLLVSDEIFKLFPDYNQGKLTVLRSNLVREKSLATLCGRLGLQHYLKMSVGELKNNGRNRISTMADLFESFVGALYLIEGYLFVKEKILPLFLQLLSELDFDDLIDYKTKLQEYIQMDAPAIIKYQVVQTLGAGYAPTFIIDVVVDGIKLGTGRGSSKKKAEQMAAKMALEKVVI